MPLDWSCAFGGALLRPRTPKAEDYCIKNGTRFACANVFFVEGYGQFWGSSEPVPPQVEVVKEFVEAPSLGGLSPEDMKELCRYWGVLPADQDSEGEAR